ncbi:MAG: DUF4239 domain-containing protein [Deltaproteobacteria bacterium]|nr:DUF4239 domain-containing protein [Deltaproteobacteria bacterium]MBI3391376.1 DUF4239 domain-containing protein [Deltaproteobacteria bacterium]
MDDPAVSIVVLALGLFAAIVLSLEIGRRIGRRRAKLSAEAATGLGAIDGAVFGLMGLVIAFTFSGAASRFDSRRHLIADEANAIGTAYLRLDLLPANLQPALRETFRRYVHSRLAVYQKLPDLQAAKEELATASNLQGEIWTQSVAACQAAGPPAAMLVLPALNQMIDITTTRTMAAQIHPPVIIFVMLVVLILASALLAGNSMAGSPTRSWTHMLAFAAAMAVAVYVILDIEYPRLGLIRIDAFDQVLVDLRESMK